MAEWNCVQKDPYGPLRFQWVDGADTTDDHVHVEAWIEHDRFTVRGMAHVSLPLWLIGELTLAHSARTAAKRLRKDDVNAE